MTETPRQIDERRPGRPASLADLVETAPLEGEARSIRLAAILEIAVIAALFVAVNWRQFPWLYQKWRTDSNWAHGFIIPLFSVYLLYARRSELLSARWRPSLWGLPLVILSILAIVLSFYPIRTYWFCQLGMVALLFSLALYLGGWQVIWITWVPILYLVFALPVPDTLYTRVAYPLQEFAAKVSTWVLQMVGVQIDVRASALTITSVTGNQYGLTVAEACSGLRSLMAYLALGVAWAYLENRAIWQRVVLVAFAVPIAILTNVVRVTITASMYVLDEPELGSDFMHEFTGILMLIPALLMFWGLGKLLQALFVEVHEDRPGEDPSAPSTPSQDAHA